VVIDWAVVLRVDARRRDELQPLSLEDKAYKFDNLDYKLSVEACVFHQEGDSSNQDELITASFMNCPNL